MEKTTEEFRLGTSRLILYSPFSEDISQMQLTKILQLTLEHRNRFSSIFIYGKSDRDQHFSLLESFLEKVKTDPQILGEVFNFPYKMKDKVLYPAEWDAEMISSYIHEGLLGISRESMAFYDNRSKLELTGAGWGRYRVKDNTISLSQRSDGYQLSPDSIWIEEVNEILGRDNPIFTHSPH